MKVRTISVSVMASTLLCVILPVQSYLVNKGDFQFSAGALVIELLCWWVVCFTGLFAVLQIFKNRCVKLLSSVIAALCIYIYLESGILASDYPMLNGDVGFWGNNIRRLWDTCILVGLLIGFVCYRKKIYQHIHFISLCVLIMAGASLLDVKTDVKTEVEDALNKEQISDDDVIINGFFSGKRNILVFVLDSMTTELASDVVGSSTNISQAFDGFTIFDNNIGMHRDTNRGLPSLLTGMYMNRSDDYTDHMKTAAGTNSFVYSYAKLDKPVFQIVHLAACCNYTNRLLKRVKIENQGFIFPTLSRMQGQQMWNLMEIVAFRSLPFAIKRKFYLNVVKNWPNATRTSCESVLYPQLAKYPVVGDCDMTLHVYHTEGSHSPYTVDKFGQPTKEPRPNYQGAFDKTYYALSQLAVLFEMLKDNGVYDNSLIIVTADHGADESKFNTPGLNGISLPAWRASPALMVKPVGADHPVSHSSIPTSHAKIKDVISHELHSIQGIESIDKILHCDIRLFRDFESTKSRHLDFWFKENGMLERVDIIDEN